MKKTALTSLTVLSLLSAAFTAQAHWPHEHEMMQRSAVWVAGTYTKTSNNGLSIGDVITDTDSNNPLNLQFDGYRATFLEPEFEWNYSLGARFHLPHSRARVFLTYDHFRDDADRDDANLLNLGSFNGFDRTPPTENSAYMQQKSDEVRLGLDRAIHFGHRFCVDVSAFFEYDRVVRDVHQVNDNTPDSRMASRDTENKVRGYGPGIGILGRAYPFHTAPHWSVFAGIMETLLFAREDFNDTWNFNFTNEEDQVDGFLVIDPEQSKSVISKIDINFGVEYSHRAHNHMFWDVALGMRFLNMFNAFKNGNTMWQPAGGGNNGLAYYAGSAEDWGRWGPYIQFSLAGAKS